MQNNNERKRSAGWDARLETAILSGALFVARRWLPVANAALAIFIGLALLAPLLMAAGATGPAQVIYGAYRITCHQQPQRSYFLAGPRLTYSEVELEAQTEERPLAGYLGSPATGYKLAFCQRDLATYAAMLLFGLLYRPLSRLLSRGGASRQRMPPPTNGGDGGRLGNRATTFVYSLRLFVDGLTPANALPGLPRLSLLAYVLLLAPLAVDGLTQAAGLRESTWLLRTLTGGLFGFATAWLLFPELDLALRRAAADLAARLRGP